MEKDKQGGGDLKLPHERDQSAGAGEATQGGKPSGGLMRQAEQDLAQGQEDTDCRNRGRTNQPHCATDKSQGDKT